MLVCFIGMFSVLRWTANIIAQSPTGPANRIKLLVCQVIFSKRKKLHKKKPSLKGLCFIETLLVTAEDLTYLLWREMEIQAHNVSVFDVIHVVVNVAWFTYRNEAIVISAVEWWDYYDHSLCIFDVDNASTCLKSLSVCALCASSRNSFMHTKSIRVHWLNTSAGLVAEVQSAFVCPLRRAFDASIEA